MIRFAAERLIRRNRAMGKVLTFSGIGLMVLGLILSLGRPSEISLQLGSAVGGMFIFQIGIGFHNRWGKSPRLDEILDRSLKGLDDRFAVFHYSLGSPHALVSPGGIFAVVPLLDEGEILYENQRWWRLKPSKRGRPRARRLDGLEDQAASAVRATRRVLHRRLPERDQLEVRPLLVFLHPNARLASDRLPLPAVHGKKLKDYLRRSAKGVTLNQDEVQSLGAALRLQPSD